MLTTEATDVIVIVTANCPHCEAEVKEELNREPYEFDMECNICHKDFTVKCKG